MNVMKFLVTVAVAAILVLPVALNAQAGNASSPAQNAPGASSAATVQASSGPQQPNTDSKKKAKVKKVKKKSNCVSPAADSGLPDYCKNPFWEPRDWEYIKTLQSAGTH
jgi:hypothetical protein